MTWEVEFCHERAEHPGGAPRRRLSLFEQVQRIGGQGRHPSIPCRETPSAGDSSVNTRGARRLVEAISTSALCCRCLERITGLSGLAVRQSLVTASRTMSLDTWTPCASCGAVDETYAMR
jgi:hypothetical protein